MKIRSTSASRSIKDQLVFFVYSVQIVPCQHRPFLVWYFARRTEKRLKKRSINTTRKMRFVQRTVDERGRRLHSCLFRPLAEVSILSSLPPNTRKKRSLFAGNSKYLLKLKKGLSSIKQIKNKNTDKQVYFDSLKGVPRTHTTSNVRPFYSFIICLLFIYLSFYLFSFNSSFNKL